MSGLIECPRCGGTWWREEVFMQLPTAEGSSRCRAPSRAWRGPRARRWRWLYFCGRCSFPGVEPVPEDHIPPWDDGEYVLVRRR